MAEPSLRSQAWIDAAVERLQQKAAYGSNHKTRTSSDQRREFEKLQRVGLSPRHLRLLLAPELLSETTSLKAARAFCKSSELWCLTLLGEYGAGKTLAAEWALLESVRTGVTVADGKNRFLGPYELRDAAYDPSARNRLKTLGTLVLDDLGCEGPDYAGTLH